MMWVLGPLRDGVCCGPLPFLDDVDRIVDDPVGCALSQNGRKRLPLSFPPASSSRWARAR